MDFPVNCLKGIPNSSFINEEGFVLPHLFYFPSQPRDENWKEQSINWEDDEGCLQLTLNQRREDGEFQFQVGVAVIPTEEVNRLCRRPSVHNFLSYERQPITDNPYHGNLLLHKNASNVLMKAIAAGLALAVSEPKLR
ncbi:MAG TPA: hypothetical protein VF918_06175 [Anaerolineales bacterium]